MASESMEGDTLDQLMEGFQDQDAPTTEELLNNLKDADIPEEMREQLKEMLMQKAPKLFGVGTSGGGPLLALAFISIIFSVILFFGYKLYKSIKEKEVKKVEKKKLKQMRKKK